MIQLIFLGINYIGSLIHEHINKHINYSSREYCHIHCDWKNIIKGLKLGKWPSKICILVEAKGRITNNGFSCKTYYKLWKKEKKKGAQILWIWLLHFPSYTLVFLQMAPDHHSRENNRMTVFNGKCLEDAGFYHPLLELIGFFFKRNPKSVQCYSFLTFLCRIWGSLCYL